jgi:hypothetical protein
MKKIDRDILMHGMLCEFFMKKKKKLKKFQLATD